MIISLYTSSVCWMMISWLNSFSARSRPRAPVRCRSAGFCSRRLIASAKASASFIGTNKPLSSCRTASRQPGASVVMQGNLRPVPQATLWAILRGKMVSRKSWPLVKSRSFFLGGPKLPPRHLQPIAGFALHEHSPGYHDPVHLPAQIWPIFGFD